MKRVLVILGILLAARLAQGILITFDFDDPGQAGADLDGLHSGSTTNSGVILTATVEGAGSDLFNQTATYFGINDSDSGDDTDQIDGGSGFDESMTFYFNTTGTLVSVDFAALDASQSDTGNIFSASASLNLDFYNGNTDGSDVLTVGSNFLAGAGNSFTISYKTGNGFALEGITIDVVPEPAAFGLMGMGFAGLLFIRRKTS